MSEVEAQRERCREFLCDLSLLVKRYERCGDIYGIEVYPPYAPIEDQSFFGWCGDHWYEHIDRRYAE